MIAKPSIHLISLGCAKNLVDSEVMLGLLARAQYPLVMSPDEAEIVIVNTCSFSADAQEEAVQTILEMAEEKRIGSIRHLVVAGCLPQRYKKNLLSLFPEVDAFVGTESFLRIVDVVENLTTGDDALFYLDKRRYLYDHTTPRINTSRPGSAYIKIAEGCSHRCAFCTIPRIRGPYRSRPMESIVRETINLSQQSVREINLVSQDSSLYGNDLVPPTSLADLLRRLAQLDALAWLRVLYLNPENISDQLLDVFREQGRICSYFDMPVQHVSDEILKTMRRPYDSRYLFNLITKIRSILPHATLRTTLLIGFPGETERHFAEMKAFIREVEFDRLGVFTYSPEEGTAAARRNDRVSKDVMEYRRHCILSLQADISRRKNKSLVGTFQDVLIEQVGDEGIVGRIAGQAPEVDGITNVNSATPVNEGSIYPIRITGADAYDLTGEVISSPGRI